MEGYGYRWYRVGGLDYLLKRSDIDKKDDGKGNADRQSAQTEPGSFSPPRA